MLGVGFDRRRDCQDPGVVTSHCGQGGKPMAALGEGAGLVEENHVHGPHPLQRQTILDQDPVAGGQIG